MYFSDVISHPLPTAPPALAQWAGECSTWANELPWSPLLHAIPQNSQTSIIPTLGSSSARPRSGCQEGKLQHCTVASPLPRVRVLVLVPQGEAFCGSPAKLPAESWHGAGASARAEQELTWLQGGGGGRRGEGGLPVHVCVSKGAPIKDRGAAT